MSNDAYFNDGFRAGRAGNAFNPPTWFRDAEMYLRYADGFVSGEAARQTAERALAPPMPYKPR